MISFPADNGGFLIVEVKQFITEDNIRSIAKDRSVAVCHLHDVINCEKFENRKGKEIVINFDFK